MLNALLARAWLSDMQEYIPLKLSCPDYVRPKTHFFQPCSELVSVTSSVNTDIFFVDSSAYLVAEQTEIPFFLPSGCIAKMQSSSRAFQSGILWKNVNLVMSSMYSAQLTFVSLKSQTVFKLDICKHSILIEDLYFSSVFSYLSQILLTGKVLSTISSLRRLQQSHVMSVHDLHKVASPVCPSCVPISQYLLMMDCLIHALP